MRRWSSFVWPMVLFMMALLSGLILGWFGWPYAELWMYIKAAFASSDPSLTFFWICSAITFLVVVVVLLLVAM